MNFVKRGIEGGKLIEIDDIDKVCDDYSEYVDFMNAMTKKQKKKFMDEKFEKRLVEAPPKRFSLFHRK